MVQGVSQYDTQTGGSKGVIQSDRQSVCQSEVIQSGS